MNISDLSPNSGKQLVIDTPYGSYMRFPVKTHVVKAGDDLFAMMDQYVRPYLEPGDMVFISEKIVAISQGRAFDIDDIKPRPLAKLLCKFVYKSPYGIGLGSPWTMELALREVGAPKMLFAAFFSAITKPFGVRGVFYKIVGTAARAIDGPCDCTLPPYNHYAKMAPDKPDLVAKQMQEHLGGNLVAVMDANDIGREVLGVSDPSLDIDMCKAIFHDNPLGQGKEQTPIAIVRKVTAETPLAGAEG
ncbi:MAG: coenzyme F420-0:L-glutamate ligase [Oscillospiraceae bacterium]|jgi:F420-0:gamma-glutamyl ligase-like protein|nr:coenzyme F420-0:L-glutamate ligase [Oscillospiraceae bacterium]